MSEDTKDPEKTTPPNFSTPEDARKAKGAGKYPNYYSHKTRSGHAFVMDDSNGAEHVTLQHRSGSAVQFKPDGSVVFTSHNGQYNVVFGENRMIVTGAYDVVVNGGGSLRVDGDYNMNVGGKVNMNITGDFNVTAQNMNQTIRGNIDVQAKNRTEKIEGSSTTQAHGAVVVAAKTGMTLGSSEGSVAVAAGKDIGLVAKGGSIGMKSGSKTNIKAGADFSVGSAGKASIKASGGTGIDGGDIKFNSGFSNEADDVENDLVHTVAQAPSPQPDVNQNVG
jgi:hypothetical protein